MDTTEINNILQKATHDDLISIKLDLVDIKNHGFLYEKTRDIFNEIIKQVDHETI